MKKEKEKEKEIVSSWFRELRDSIVSSFENIEDTHCEGPLADKPAGRFAVSNTKRKSGDNSEAGGGLMSIMRNGRVFEKVGVNISTVFGSLSEGAKTAMATRKKVSVEKVDDRFWASGISVVAHMQNPHCPAVHMNTRMFWTPSSWWFGGGSDLNPCIEGEEDTSLFHSDLKICCDAHDINYYPRFKKWADEYFYIPHREKTRGVGGIFFDDLSTGDWLRDFKFTQDVGRVFLPTFLTIINRRRNKAWTEVEKDVQHYHRGLYAEYNLVYDRGTKFGLETGHDPDAVLMSLPPVAKWY